MENNVFCQLWRTFGADVTPIPPTTNALHFDYAMENKWTFMEEGDQERALGHPCCLWAIPMSL
eukprot:4057715-Amphidinium_carterae.1